MNELLIATFNKLIYWKKGKCEITAEGNYYGVTWSNNCLYASLNPPHEQISIIKVFDKSFNLLYDLPDKRLLGVHQIFFWLGELFITNTSIDRIEIFDTEQFKYSGHIAHMGNGEADNFHFNSFWCDGKLFYVCESGSTQPLPAIQMLDLDSNLIDRFELPGVSHMHNVYVENDILFSCEKYGMVVKELSSRKTCVVDLRIDRKAFFRGLAKTKDYFFIGESQEFPRKKREFGDSRILILDNDLRLIDTIELVDTGQIQDIRVANGDLAHNGIDLF